MNISICIPTFNRAEKLRETLSSLARFFDKDLEIVIGNNASQDETDGVVENFLGVFPHLVYLKHDENLGFARNIDSIIMRAQRKYIYVLSDDDIVYENALQLSISLLEQDEDLVAVVGGYESLRKLNPEAQIDYSEAVVTTIPQGAYAALLQNLSICDGHPVMRRRVFHRFCSYHERTVGLLPLYFKILEKGKIYVIDKPFFQHRTSSESLTSRMAEPWFLDMWFADIELAAGMPGADLEVGLLESARQQMMRTLYLQAARMSQNQKRYYELWFFMRRLMAINGAGDLVLHAESNFLHEFVVERLRRLLDDCKFSIIGACDGDIISSLLNVMNVKTHDLKSTSISECDVIFVDAEDPASVEFGQLGKNVITLTDIFNQIRLSTAPATFSFGENRLLLNYLSEEVRELVSRDNLGLQILMAPYSEISE